MNQKPLTSAILRILDICLAAASLIFLSPLLLLISVAIWMTLGRPILFCQMRSGRFEKPFCIFKFRTMRDSKQTVVSGDDDANRLSKLGRFLRRTSMDELPELLNVLLGQMSLVGPRPLLVEYSDFYTPAEKTRFAVRPGLTGLAQVSGRTGLTWNEKLSLDAQYVDEYAVKLYILILLRTALTVVNISEVPDSPFDHEQRLDRERPRYAM